MLSILITAAIASAQAPMACPVPPQAAHLSAPVAVDPDKDIPESERYVVPPAPIAAPAGPALPGAVPPAPATPPVPPVPVDEPTPEDLAAAREMPAPPSPRAPMPPAPMAYSCG